MAAAAVSASPPPAEASGEADDIAIAPMATATAAMTGMRWAMPMELQRACQAPLIAFTPAFLVVAPGTHPPPPSLRSCRTVESPWWHRTFASRCAAANAGSPAGEDKVFGYA